MMHGRNNGKKLMAVRIVKHAMEIIHLLTDANPIQIIVDAIINRFLARSALRIVYFDSSVVFFLVKKVGYIPTNFIRNRKVVSEHNSKQLGTYLVNWLSKFFFFSSE